LRRINRAFGSLPYAPVAQLDRASAFGAEGWEFESLRAHHLNALKHLSDSRPFINSFCVLWMG
jgi:hypothetical protein